jgi:hypothetical protein
MLFVEEYFRTGSIGSDDRRFRPPIPAGPPFVDQRNARRAQESP